MAMQNIEVASAAINLLQHHHMQRVGISDGTVEAQSSWPHSLELRRRRRIATGKQRNLVAERDQLFGEPGHDSLGAAVKLRRNSFSQRRNLCDLHLSLSHLRRFPTGRQSTTS